MLRRILRRIRAIYFTQLVLCCLLALAVLFHLHGVDRWQVDLLHDDVAKGALASVTLLYEPNYLGILPMYLVFLAVAPVVLWLFANLDWRLVVASSLLVWIVAGLEIHLPDDPSGLDLGGLNPFSYQLLFVVGLGFGAGHLRIGRVPGRLWALLVVSSLVVVAVCLALRLEYALGGPVNAVLDDAGPWFSAIQLGPLRVLNFAAFAIAIYWVCGRTSWLESGFIGLRWLGFLGRHSLQVFAWSVIATYAAVALFPPHVGTTSGFLALILVTASLTIPAQIHTMMRPVVRNRELREARAHGAYDELQNSVAVGPP